MEKKKRGWIILVEDFMGTLFVVGHGLNTQGVYENKEAANQAAKTLSPITINNTVVAATVSAVDADRYVIDKEQGFVVERKGGNTHLLNSVLENH
jgi:hypothetical protein